MQEHQVCFHRPSPHLLGLTAFGVADTARYALSRVCGLVARGEVSDIAVLAKKRYEDFRPGLGLAPGPWVIVEEVGGLMFEPLPKLLQRDLPASDLPRLT